MEQIFFTQRFRKALEDGEIHNKINSFMERKFNRDEIDVENAYELFENLVTQ